MSLCLETKACRVLYDNKKYKSSFPKDVKEKCLIFFRKLNLNNKKNKKKIIRFILNCQIKDKKPKDKTIILNNLLRNISS